MRFHVSSLVALLPLLSIGCTPDNAEIVEGSYVAFVSADTSVSLLKGVLDLEQFDGEQWNIDCREFETLTEEQADDRRLPDALPICKKSDLRNSDIGVRDWPGDTDDVNEEPYFPNYTSFGPNHEEWIVQGPYHALAEDLTPWRGEGVVTSEGDIQVSFHHFLPDGSDFRFAFVIDPDFAPRTCVQEGDEVVAEPIDGDWIENWSAEFADYLGGLNEEEASRYAHMSDYVLNGGKVWALTAGAYQLNPSNTDDYWFFPEEYSAGHAAGKFVDERMTARGARYGEPYVYNFMDADSALGITVGATDLWHCDMDADVDPNECPPCDRTEGQWDIDGGGDDFCELGSRVDRVADEVAEELAIINPYDNPTLDYRPLVLHNSGRTPDSREPGLDGWTGMHYNYVTFSKDSVLEEGGVAEGAFSHVLDAEDGKSGVCLSGKFRIDPIKKDLWVADNLREIKLAESDDVKDQDSLCFGK